MNWEIKKISVDGDEFIAVLENGAVVNGRLSDSVLDGAGRPSQMSVGRAIAGAVPMVGDYIGNDEDGEWRLFLTAGFEPNGAPRAEDVVDDIRLRLTNPQTPQMAAGGFMHASLVIEVCDVVGGAWLPRYSLPAGAPARNEYGYETGFTWGEEFEAGRLYVGQFEDGSSYGAVWAQSALPEPA